MDFIDEVRNADRGRDGWWSATTLTGRLHLCYMARTSSARCAG